MEGLSLNMSEYAFKSDRSNNCTRSDINTNEISTMTYTKKKLLKIHDYQCDVLSNTDKSKLLEINYQEKERDTALCELSLDRGSNSYIQSATYGRIIENKRDDYDDLQRIMNNLNQSHVVPPSRNPFFIKENNSNRHSYICACSDRKPYLIATSKRIERKGGVIDLKIYKKKDKHIEESITIQKIYRGFRSREKFKEFVYIMRELQINFSNFENLIVRVLRKEAWNIFIKNVCDKLNIIKDIKETYITSNENFEDINKFRKIQMKWRLFYVKLKIKQYSHILNNKKVNDINDIWENLIDEEYYENFEDIEEARINSILNYELTCPVSIDILDDLH